MMIFLHNCVFYGVPFVSYANSDASALLHVFSMYTLRIFMKIQVYCTVLRQDHSEALPSGVRTHIYGYVYL